MEDAKFNWEEKYASVIDSNGHTVFFDRFLSATQIDSLFIISPWITSLENEQITLNDIMNKIKNEQIKTTIITRDPNKEQINRVAVDLFRKEELITLYFNNELHAKVYICRCSPFGFALVSSANLSGNATRAYEVGVFIEGKGYGRELIEKLQLLGTDDIPNRSGTFVINN